MVTKLAANTGIFLIKSYQKAISPAIHALGGGRCGCRFIPSCSEYAAECLNRFGFIRGSILTSWRILRCAPWSKGGLDPVPERWTHGFRRSSHASDPGDHCFEVETANCSHNKNG